MTLKPSLYHRGLKLYKVYINGDPGLTLIYFTAMSNLVTYNLNIENCYKVFNGKNLQQSTKLTE